MGRSKESSRRKRSADSKDFEYNENSSTVSRINAFIDFFERNTLQSEEPLDPRTDFNVDINLCLTDSMLLQKWPSIMGDLNGNPQQTFSCMRVALFEVTLRRSTVHQILSYTRIFRTLRLNRINISNHESLNALSQLNLSAYGKLTSISGIVINTSLPKINTAFVVIVCTCKREIIVKQENEICFVPRRCKVCGNGNFERSLDSIYQFTKVEQIIQIKDYRLTDQKIEDDASSPNIISVKLTDTLVDKFVPGDKIRVVGIPRITLGAVKSTTPGLCPLYIDAISTFGADDGLYGLVENPHDIPLNRNIIEAILSEPDVLRLLVKSLCPNVQGHETIKAALILALFSGGFRSGTCTRDYIHMLIIGDLGLSKTELLRACAQIAPKGVYIRGSSMKSLEPEMINVRDVGMKDSCLEAGAFTLARGSVCCIDEIDKIPAQHQSIHTCMENLVVNITNSEMKLELEALTGIVGMMNPRRKCYDPSKTVIENVNASQELISRFDMVFVMRDYPDMYRDKMISDQSLDMHTKRKQLTEKTQFSGSTSMSESPSRSSGTLMERLATPDESKTEILPTKFFQMYLNYARMYVYPQISSGPKNAIKLFCTSRYETHQNFVNTERQIRILVTLSQARAKSALRAEVTDEDFCDVMGILEHMILIQKKNLSGGQPMVSSSNSNKLTTSKVNQFLNELRTESKLLGKTTFTKDELQNVAGKENVTGHIFSTLLTRLNEQGYLLKVSSNMYKMVSN